MIFVWSWKKLIHHSGLKVSSVQLYVRTTIPFNSCRKCNTVRECLCSCHWPLMQFATTCKCWLLPPQIIYSSKLVIISFVSLQQLPMLSYSVIFQKSSESPACLYHSNYFHLRVKKYMSWGISSALTAGLWQYEFFQVECLAIILNCSHSITSPIKHTSIKQFLENT